MQDKDSSPTDLQMSLSFAARSLKTDSHLRVLVMTSSANTEISIRQKAKLKRVNANELFLELHEYLCVIVRGTACSL